MRQASLELSEMGGETSEQKLHAGLNKQLGLSNELFVLGDSLVLTVLGQVSFMPILVLAARLCPEVRSCLIQVLMQLYTAILFLWPTFKFQVQWWS